MAMDTHVPASGFLWIPACAGMTGYRGACPRLDRGNDGFFYATIGINLVGHEKNPP